MSDQGLEKPLPQNLEAEQLVLGGILAGTKSHRLAFDLLTPDDFFLDRHRRIFRKALEHDKAGKPTDLLSMDDALRSAGEIEAVGGTPYLASLGDGLYSAFDVEHYARIIKDKALLRNLIHVSGAIQQQAFQAEEAAEEILDRSAQSLIELAQQGASAHPDGFTCRDAAVRLLTTFDERTSPRIFTGIAELDKIIGGFRGGEVVIVTADTGVGKTLCAQQTRRQACHDGYVNLYCSGEMPAHQLISRELASQAAVAHWKMRQPERLEPHELRALVECAAHECDRCRILDGELTLPRIRLAARRMKAQSDLGLVVVDYDELVEAPGETEFDQQRELARGAKSMAMELGCVVMLISQLRKIITGEDVKRPTLQRLYGSGAKSKHASVVLFVDREYVRELRGDETVARIAILKNRDGRVGSLDAVFNVRTLRFESAPKAGDAASLWRHPSEPREREQ